MAKHRRRATRRVGATQPKAAQSRGVPSRRAKLAANLTNATFDVLDSGFVRVVDYMGNDSSIVQAARVSYGEGTKRVQGDRGLIRYLMRHSHTTPFEMCELKLHIRAPMDVWRQWIRHRTASVNEYSTRYSIAIDAAQQTPKDGWRYQASSNRQGSNGSLSTSRGAKLSSEERKLQRFARQAYEARLAAGVAREQARKDLPLSTYTEAYWKINLHNLFHFLELRMDQHAQNEIRAYADVIGNKIVAEWVPAAWEAFRDYRLDGLKLSRIEIQIVRALVQGQKDYATAVAGQAGLLSNGSGDASKRNREGTEFEAKAITLGLGTLWSEIR
jgi:thymidylate synthase (FAD)